MLQEESSVKRRRHGTVRLRVHLTLTLSLRRDTLNCLGLGLG